MSTGGERKMAGKKPQRGLGRGLGALLGEDVVSPAEEKAADEVLNLEIRLIDPNREQPGGVLTRKRCRNWRPPFRRWA